MSEVRIATDPVVGHTRVLSNYFERARSASYHEFGVKALRRVLCRTPAKVHRGPRVIRFWYVRDFPCPARHRSAGERRVKPPRLFEYRQGCHFFRWYPFPPQTV